MSHPIHIPEDLGLGLAPGEHHYRAYVEPPEDYDLIAAMTFNLLKASSLLCGDPPGVLNSADHFDYAVAQSIFRQSGVRTVVF